MEGRTEYPGTFGAVPPGFALAQAALARFHEERVVASDVQERDAERAHVTMVVTDALAAGSLVVFVRTQQDEILPVPVDAWRPHLLESSRPHINVGRLHKSGLRHDNPLVVAHETFAAKGIALVDLNNWAGFSKYADRWPPFEIPASVRLILKFCEHKDAMSEGLQWKKSDAISWFQQNWPSDLDHLWPIKHRLDMKDNNKDKYPKCVSEFTNVVLNDKKRAGGNYKGEIIKAITDRRKRMAPARVSDADLQNELATIDD
ncbi:hypothetical protein [Methylobacterium sp. E-045]|uniref:hypothetical protein n=1 Tax=Methylobacterium sp. E-045 TaxID=2836575 RepID=UPI001FB91551|nr:hypothetical protein [Methylobacterium sp. E-045]MCJ2130892.1 hypothetical protein [Methylobacterium sp. E-045]